MIQRTIVPGEEWRNYEMKDAGEILYEYIRGTGIVVDFPHTTDKNAQAVVDYANQLENELQKTEKTLVRARKAFDKAYDKKLSEVEFLRNQLGDMKGVIRDLLEYLPDSFHLTNESWSWCWDELDGDAQDEVKNARTHALDALAKAIVNPDPDVQHGG